MKKILVSSVVMAVMTAAPIAPVLASGFDDVTKVNISNSNSAYVGNDVTVKADTGDNSANGGYAGGAGDGGSVNNSDDNNTGGAGGNGGNGGLGGVIQTGNATAAAGVTNKVNTNKTKVNLCDCLNSHENSDDKLTVDVHNTNKAKVRNNVYVKADTGDNSANGGSAGGGAGNGGSVNSSDDGNTGGAGGNAGDGGEGGVIWTGHAVAAGAVVNRVNTNITRVR